MTFTLKCYENKMLQLEDQQDEHERRDRRDDVLLYDVPELANETIYTCERKIKEVVNDVVPDLLSESDIVRAHRVGQKSGNKPRPLIVKLARTTKKMAIQAARADFRVKGIGVSGDLTPKQRDMVRQAYTEEKIGYFKGGKFYTKPRRTNDSSPNRRVTRSQNQQRQTPR